MKTFDICLTPALLPLFDLKGKVVVVADILRATSCMVTALAHGVASITPVATLEECAAFKAQGYLTCAERDGLQAEGFDLGNSPFGFMHPDLQGRHVAMTTTNGTYAITHSQQAHQIIIGSFLNLSAVIEFLLTQEHSVVLVCAGWKGMVNAEDTLFAGAVAAQLKDDFAFVTDTPMMAELLYNQAVNDMMSFLSRSSHVRRLNNLDIYKDIAFCLNVDEYHVIPVLQDGRLVLQTQEEEMGV